MTTRYCWIAFATLLTGCTALQAPKVVPSHLYILDTTRTIQTVPQQKNWILVISQPTSRAGFDTPRMAYQSQPLALEYFAYHRWADTPARMLKPLIAQALNVDFRTVVQAPSGLPADLRLDTELIRLQQNFVSKPSQIQLTLRAQLVDLKNKRIIASKLFDERENTSSDDPYGGVLAANRALQRVLTHLTQFCLKASP